MALTLGGLLLIHLLSSSLTSAAGASAHLRAEGVANLVAGGTVPKTLTVPGDDSVFVQVIDSTGRVLASSDNVADESAVISPGSSGRVRVVTAHGLPVADQGDFRLATQSVVTPKGRWTVVAAASLTPAEHTVATLSAALAAGLPIVLALVGLTAWLLAGRALAPVEAIRRQVAEISGRALDRRVPDPGGHDEIARLAQTMNDMLARLERSQASQRRFVADASHELRSPLASALTQLQVELAHPAQADWAATAAGIQAELERLQRMLVDLLALARADEGALARGRTVIDLDEIVHNEVSLQRITSRVPIDTSAVAPVQLQATPDELRRVVGNLIGNAVRHARTRVTVSLARPPGGALLVVADDGPGIPPGQLDRVFGRFVRLDDARSRDTGGTGLGLAIAKEIIEAHGGTITVGDARPGARFEVRLPVPSDERHDRDPGRGRGDAEGQPAESIAGGLARGALLGQPDGLP
jgi:signal transduction histidine kinase